METIVGVKPVDLTGRVFGDLTVEGPAGLSEYGRMTWWCRCACGALSRNSAANLRSGSVKSCGCRKLRRTETERKAYRAWKSMIRRCNDPSRDNYHRYGGRGISVCDRWRAGENGLSGFDCFMADMGERPAGKSLDRINNDGNYEPSNCRWATQSQQNLNSRRTAKIDCGGERLLVVDVAREIGITPQHLKRRMRAGLQGDALFAPPQNRNASKPPRNTNE